MKIYIYRILKMLTGLFLFALGIILTIRANIGYAPWDVFHVGISTTVGLSLGIVSIAVGLAILVIVLLAGERFGLGTILNIILIGLFLDLILAVNIIPLMETFISGLIMMLIGLIAISIGTYMYISAGFGVGPRDSLMVVLTKKTKIPVGICRSFIELIVTVLGWFLGGLVGIGTVITAFGIGLCVQLTFKLMKFDVTAVKHESLIDTFAVLFKRKRASQCIP